MDRKNSTTMPTGTRIQAWSDSRPTPSSAPIGSAITTLTAAASKVAHSPGSRYVVQFWISRNGDHFSAVSWFLDANVEMTYQASSNRKAAKTTLRIRLKRLALGPGMS